MQQKRIFNFLILAFMIMIICNLMFKKKESSFEEDIVNCKSFIYNIAWEDPEIDFKYLNIGSDDTILMITTGGCNILNTLLQNPKKIVTIDISKCQNALLDLKIASIKKLKYETFWKLFGLGVHENFPKIYREILRDSLRLDSSRQFWDNNQNIFVKGLYKSGATGLGSRILTSFVSARMKKLCSFDRKEEQYKYYKSYIEPYVFNFATKHFVDTAAINFAGVPQNQINTACGGKCKQGQFYNFVKDSYEYLVENFSIKNENYFFYGLINGEFSRNNCPNYLKRENFEFLRNNVHKIEINTTTITNYLKKSNTKFTRFILLDHMDWFKNEKELYEEFKYIKKQSVANRSLGIFRSGHPKPWIVDKLKKLNYINIKDYSFESKNDRLGTYPGFYLFKIV